MSRSYSIFAAATLLVACSAASTRGPKAEPTELLAADEKPAWIVEAAPEPTLPPVVRSAMDQVLAPAGPETMALAPQDDLTFELRLTHGRCAFAEPEPDWQSDAETAEACREVNLLRFEDREQQVLTVPAGTYAIAITNPDIPRALGFWLRPEATPEVTLASGGGIGAGETEVFEVILEPGRYLYSCPVSPTPDYVLDVTEAYR